MDCASIINTSLPTINQSLSRSFSNIPPSHPQQPHLSSPSTSSSHTYPPPSSPPSEKVLGLWRGGGGWGLLLRVLLQRHTLDHGPSCRGGVGLRLRLGLGLRLRLGLGLGLGSSAFIEGTGKAAGQAPSHMTCPQDCKLDLRSLANRATQRESNRAPGAPPLTPTSS